MAVDEALTAPGGPQTSSTCRRTVESDGSEAIPLTPFPSLQIDRGSARSVPQVEPLRKPDITSLDGAGDRGPYRQDEIE